MIYEGIWLLIVGFLCLLPLVQGVRVWREDSKALNDIEWLVMMGISLAAFLFGLLLIGVVLFHWL